MHQTHQAPGSLHRIRLAERAGFLETLTRECWSELSSSLEEKGPPPEFSGIHSLRDPLLHPFLELPGVFLILGPTPDFTILHIGAAQGPMGRKVWARLEPLSLGRFAWRWEAESDPEPTYAACIVFSGNWGLIPAMKALVTREAP